MKTLLILSPKGGSGKSTAARNLAAAAASDGFRVVGLDTDEQGTFSHWITTRTQVSDLPAIDGKWIAIADAYDEIRRTEADIVVVDTPTAVEQYPAEIKRLILTADLVVVPCQPSADDVRSVGVFMGTVLRMKKTAAFLVNRVRPRVKEAEGARRELARVGHVLGAGIPDSVELQRALANGWGVTESQGRGHEEFRSAWEEIRRLIGL